MSLARQLPKPALIILIALLSMAPPLATDLFLPAIPSMPAYFDTTEAMVNFALVAFFFCMALGMLIVGPLSDKYGRKRPMLISVTAFIIFAIACSLSTSIHMLIVCRIFQGLAGGGMVALGTALVKDCFEGKTRERALIVVTAIGVLAPMAAPVLGAAILSFTSWRGTFVAMAIIALCSLPFAILLKEPLAKENRITEGIAHSLGRLLVVGKNKSFIILLFLLALHGLPYMTYISVVSYIYIDFFGMTAVQCSLFFATNAVLSAVGALLVEVVERFVTKRKAIVVCVALTVVSGLLVITVGWTSPVVFLLSFGITTLMGGIVRPMVTVILLDQQEGDTGSASALINFVVTVLGSLGMIIAMAPWENYVLGLGVVAFACCAIVMVGLLVLLRSKIHIKGLEK